MAVSKIRFLRGFLFLFAPLILLGGVVFAVTPTPAPEDASQTAKRYQEITEQINKLALQLSQAQNQEKTLAGQIIYFDNQTKLTNLKIAAAKNKLDELVKQIDELSGKIIRLDDSLSDISAILISRIVETYKRGITPQWEFLMKANSLPEVLNDYKYLKTAQAHDKSLMYQMEATKRNYREQKDLREIKKKEAELLKKQLESYTVELAKQKKEKERLLEVTRNDEKRYQQMLEDARREAEQIEKALKIIGSDLSKFPSKHVNKGDAIGIQGCTGYCFGDHLHFGAYNYKKGDIYQYASNDLNPCEFVDCSGGEVRDGRYAAPMNSAKISQGYGRTDYYYLYRDGFHHGLDMFNNENPMIKAAESGEAIIYRGGQSNGNGVFIYHDDGKMTLYWHLQ